MLAHVSNNNHCVLLTRPAFSRQDNQIFRQIGRMFVDAEDDLAVTIAWQGGKNSSGTVQIPPATIHYFFKLLKSRGRILSVWLPLWEHMICSSKLSIHSTCRIGWMATSKCLLNLMNILSHTEVCPAVEQEQQTQPSPQEANNAQIPQQQQPANQKIPDQLQP